MAQKVIAYLLALQSLLVSMQNQKQDKSLDSSWENKEIIEVIPEDKSDIPQELFEEDHPILKLEVGYLLRNSKLYSDLDLSEEMDIDIYQKVTIIDQINDYYAVTTDTGINGYIFKKNIAILPDTYVEVDISDQTLYYYLDGELLIKSDVVTGKNSTPTYIGYFDIANKARDTRLKGPILSNGRRAWDNHVDYWMAFDGSRGFHDADWRNEFGGDIYQQSGSHGCVNLPYDTAKALYENAPVHTRVLVHK